MVNKRDKKVKVYTKKKHIPESQIISDLQTRYDNIDEIKINSFSDLPLSSRTQKGLKENEY